MEKPLEWSSLMEFVKAVYMAQVHGIIDPRLELAESNYHFLTEDQLRQMEEWGKAMEESDG